MQRRIRFAEANLAWISAYCRALREGFRRGVQEIARPDEIAAIETDPEGWLTERLSQEGPLTLPNGVEVERVPQSIFWMLVDDRFVGESSLRWRLNKELEQTGGHIGYGVHPDFQGRGYGKELLQRTLRAAHEGGLSRLLVTASRDNIASWRVIEACGGKFESEVTESVFHTKGDTVRRYWIEP